MSSLKDRPIILVVVIVALVGALWFSWSRYRAMTGVTKENSVQMIEDEVRRAMQRD